MNSRSEQSQSRVWVLMALALALVYFGPTSPAIAEVKILATKVESSCSPELPRCGGRRAFAATYSNGIVITLETTTHNSYNATGPGLKYIIYDVNDTPVVTFTCSQPVVRLHSAALLDNAQYYVVISAGSSKSPKYQFATSSQPCKGKPSPKRQ